MDSDQAWSRGWKTAFSNLSGETFEAASNFNLLVIPMFVLMGNLAGVSGMSNDLFAAAYRWMGHMRGRVGIGNNCGLRRFCRALRFIARLGPSRWAVSPCPK